jgi:hypothetical protein
LLVTYRLETLTGQTWTVQLDDGRTSLQLRQPGTMSRPEGRWVPVLADSGGEGILRWTGWMRAASRPDMARVVHHPDETVSTGQPITERCTS